MGRQQNPLVLANLGEDGTEQVSSRSRVAIGRALQQWRERCSEFVWFLIWEVLGDYFVPGRTVDGILWGHRLGAFVSIFFSFTASKTLHGIQGPSADTSHYLHPYLLSLLVGYCP